MIKCKLFLIVFMLAVTIPLFSQNMQTVTGRVTLQDTGEELPGTTIMIKGTQKGTIADANGNYTISAPYGSTLVYSFIGMNAVEHKATQPTINVTLSEGVNIEEVVVIGYGGAKKSDLTGSVGVLNSSELLNGNPMSVSQGLQGKMAGVNVTQSDGAPGAGMNILIRGVNSFSTSSEPLYVVDGVPFDSSSAPSSEASGSHLNTNPMSMINPSDIESITVLKDASSTAIYGSRGANGVVIITTKKGKKGGDRIEFSTNFGFSNVIKKLDVLDGASYVRYRNEAVRNYIYYDNAQDDLPYPETGPGHYDPKLNLYIPSYDDFANGYLNGGTDWQDQIFQTGFTQEYNLSYSGASDKGNYSVSGGYSDQKGTIHSSGYNRISLRTNINRTVYKGVRLGTSTSVVRTVGNFAKTSTSSNSVVRSALWYPSDLPIYDEKLAGGFTQVDWLAANPYLQTRDSKDEIVSYNIFSSNYLELDLLKDLKFKQTIGFNYTNNNRYTYYGRYTLEGKAPTNGLAGQADNWNTGLTLESMLTYDKTFNQNHHLNVMAAFTAERSDWGGKSITAYDFDNDYMMMYKLSAGKKQKQPQSGRGMSSLSSVLGRVNYDLMNRYLFTASFRYDGSSKFAKNNRWAFFPSVAAAWRASEEDFIKNLNLFSNLKVRASYGQTGNQGINSYQTVSSLTPVTSALNGNIVSGGIDSYLNNTQLIWETTEQVDLGLEIGFLDNRLNFTVDLYHKKTSDLLQNLIIPYSTGFQSKVVNSGNIINRGLELSMRAFIFTGKNFKWDVDANIAFNRNHIEGLDKDQFAQALWSDVDQVFIQRQNCPVGYIYGYKEDGFYDNEAEVRADPEYKNASQAIIRSKIGEIKYKDLDGKTGITADDRTIIGDVNPDFTFGFTTNFQWKNLALGLFFQGSVGNDIFNGNKMEQTMTGVGNITREAYETRWTPNNYETAKWPKAYEGLGRKIKISDRFVEDGSYLRLKSLNLSYDFKSPMKFINSLVVGATITNLFTITNYSWYDPEVNAFGGDSSRRGVDIFSYPSSRTYSLNFKFVL